MNTEIKEQLSALMDGEVQRDAARFVLRAVDSDPALAADWTRFHIARDCLQRKPVLLADAGFAAAVMARLDAETAPQRSGGSRWARYLSGGAVAAAVAVVALMASAPEKETLPGSATIASTAAPPRAATFNDSSISGPRLPQLAQPASATVGGDTLFAPGYDLRAPSAGWRPAAEAGYNVRSPATPYVLLIVPVQPAATEHPAQPRLQ
ncbi:sigma-E factor negative regulatory protein [Tahibacter caeni]|uniref:sigma-E factor negative regulatory protein n=1 Tax=Tahibacter caeni TaxID=1453545 RepID=UPI002148E7AE|nr:sigma-E factor negative regulatory protein [Tahibacter caeni]